MEDRRSVKVIIKHKKISELKPAPYNPRVDLQPEDEEYQQLLNSMKHFGYIVPIIVNKRTGFVIGGNQRLKILKELKQEKVDIVEIDLPEDKEKALNIALNRIAGDWEYETLQKILKDFEPDELNLAGFAETDVDAFVEREIEKQEEEDEKEIKFNIYCKKDDKPKIEKDLSDILERQVKFET
ncbi:ParB N-terminal domain-containing protein [candidate division WOR-3 bacterium]|nr:ParB N-terminal domain-containing protein [candidate division WOR-3 bacterium]